jgi:hypothetical protein
MYFMRDGGFAQRTIPDWPEAIAGRGAGPACPIRSAADRRWMWPATPLAKPELGIRGYRHHYMSLLKVNGE